MFLSSMKDRVRGKGLRIAYAEGMEERAIRAAALLRDENLANPVLIGARGALEEKMAAYGVSPAGIELHDPIVDPLRHQYVDEYFDLRKHKGITSNQAEEKMRLPHYYGAMMVRQGAVDGMVSGLNSET